MWLMVIKVGDKWCKATTTWKFWWNFLAKSILFSRYPSFSPFERPDAYKCYIFSESYGSRETREIKISTSKFDLEARGILSSLWTQTGPWSDTASYCSTFCVCVCLLGTRPQYEGALYSDEGQIMMYLSTKTQIQWQIK